MHRIQPAPTRVAQTADSLKAALQRASWTQGLPGERILSRDLGVSRPTLRAALEILERQKWIRTSRGRRRMIIPRAEGLAGSQNGLKKVILLAKEAEKDLSRMSLLYVEALRSRLQSAGYEFEFHFHPMLGRPSPRPGRRLLPGVAAASAFILFSLPEGVQRHCRNMGYPAIIAGSAADGVELPSLDIDYHGVGRHAAGFLMGRGHRQIALFTCDGGLKGDLLTQSGFLEAVSFRSDGEMHAEVIRHRDDSDDLRLKVRNLMKRGRAHPTGIIASRASHAVTILCELLRLGWQVPGEVSLICRDYEPVLDWTAPKIGRYGFFPERFAARLAKMTESVASGMGLPTRASLLTPEFDMMDSLKSLNTNTKGHLS